MGEHYSGERPADGSLESRIRHIDDAYEELDREANDHLLKLTQKLFEGIVARLDCYRSHDDLDGHGPSDVRAAWTTYANDVVNYVRSSLWAICQEQENWIQDQLRPILEAARAQHPARWFETPAFAVCAVVAGATFIAAGAYVRVWWLALPSLLTLATGLVFPRRYKRRYDPKSVLRPLDLTSAQRMGRSVSFVVEASASDEDASIFMGNLAGIVGGVFLGPLGASGAGLLGGLLGKVFGSSLEKRKERFYKQVAEQLEQQIKAMMEELNRQAESYKVQVKDAVRKNYRENAARVIALLEDC